MTSYKGSLRIAATSDKVDAVFEVDDQNLTVKTGDEALGSWPIAELQPNDTGTEVLLALDGESVAMQVFDHPGFVAAIAPPQSTKRSRRIKSPRPAKQREPKPQRERRALLPAVRNVLDRDTWQNWLTEGSGLWVVASVAVIIVAALAVFATSSLGMILVLIGMVALIIAALAVSDDLSAYSWIPGNLSEVTLVIGGAVAMAIGGLLIVIG